LVPSFWTFASSFSRGFSEAGAAELTADPLARAWRSVMAESTDLTEDDRKVLSGIQAEITDLIKLRNDWSHGTWFVGYGTEAEWSRALLHRFKNSKGLVTPSDLEVLPTAEYITDVASHTAFITQAIFDFSGNVRLLRDKGTGAHPADRIRIIKGGWSSTVSNVIEPNRLANF
jgi:hypothetical protein